MNMPMPRLPASPRDLPRDAQSILELAARSMFDLFANASEGMLITDAHSRIIAANPAFSRITGYSPAEVAGRSPALLPASRADMLAVAVNCAGADGGVSRVRRRAARRVRICASTSVVIEPPTIAVMSCCRAPA